MIHTSIPPGGNMHGIARPLRLLFLKANFFKDKTEEIKKILSEGYVKTACFKNEPTALMGMIVVYQGKTACLFIKKDFRDQGIEELLYNSIKDRLNGNG